MHVYLNNWLIIGTETAKEFSPTQYLQIPLQNILCYLCWNQNIIIDLNLKVLGNKTKFWSIYCYTGHTTLYNPGTTVSAFNIRLGSPIWNPNMPFGSKNVYLVLIMYDLDPNVCFWDLTIDT